VSRRFVALSTEQMHEWLSRRLDELDLPIMMIGRGLQRIGRRGPLEGRQAQFAGIDTLTRGRLIAMRWPPITTLLGGFFGCFAC
jgi:hypothetical protein